MCKVYMVEGFNFHQFKVDYTREQTHATGVVISVTMTNNYCAIIARGHIIS